MLVLHASTSSCAVILSVAPAPCRVFRHVTLRRTWQPGAEDERQVFHLLKQSSSSDSVLAGMSLSASDLPELPVWNSQPAGTSRPKGAWRREMRLAADPQRLAAERSPPPMHAKACRVEDKFLGRFWTASSHIWMWRGGQQMWMLLLRQTA